ncbi:glycine betaine ABC transporter substrate-binding protein [Desulfosporosinus sp. PR]|uniref:ABC transporter substrate-binding protein n=1 Tax=Candidatus Desulfosporosinus nitrosoreducens TaxID=3401928 RepID=UPI0027F78018|nr:glycine betaine ABC transporter substrate-binding protein [Desulfosporosinus sp. PR]MDQ7095263.1 glycine betaine ABC transporter substrate-binding protein [Desulfosporosinus sp. PR]
MKSLKSKITKSVIGVLSASLVLSMTLVGCGSSGASSSSGSVQTIRVSHQPEFETFMTYDGMQKGLDTKAGIKIQLVYFDSGMPQVSALPGKAWDIGATGCVPMLMAAVRYDAYMIAVGDDESLCNMVMTRTDSPLLQTQNPNGTYGTADQLKGKNILVTTVSGGEYTLVKYLESLGLKESDVKISNMEQAQAVSAFDSNVGDAVTLWTPFTYTGKTQRKSLANGAQVGAHTPIAVLVDKTYADQHPDQVVKFLDVYFQGIDRMKSQNTQLADEYQKFMKDWGGIDISKDDATKDIQNHTIYNLKEQLALFDNSKGTSQVATWMNNVADFFTKSGKFTADENQKLQKDNYITDKFLKMLAKEKGITQ